MSELVLIHPTPKIIKKREKSTSQQLEKKDYSKYEANFTNEARQVLVYWQVKLSHNGLTAWKQFEGFSRKMSDNSMRNLLNSSPLNSHSVKYFASCYRLLKSEKLKKAWLQVANEKLFNDEYSELLRMILNKRCLNETQSRKLKSYAQKLCYYSQTRIFTSKKTGTYKMKVGFLTLTAPETASDQQFLKAFEGFLDYLRRTANCHYVYKKELGEQNNKLHVHLLINNFIPYYIIQWKWKRLLIGQGVQWEKNEKGEETKSHYRIELPRSKKMISYYIAKYMSKAYEIDRKLGYIFGKSKILDDLKENRYFENELEYEEVMKLKVYHKTISDQFLTHICCDCLKLRGLCDKIYYLFEKQYLEFSAAITLPQKFNYV